MDNCCLTELGKICMEKLIDGALAELRPVFCFTSIANDFEKEKNRLEPEIKTIEQRSREAAGRGNDIRVNVLDWKKRADKLIQEDIKTKQTCFFGFCPDCIWRYKKGKELANNIEEIKQLIEKGERLENIEVHRRLPGVERHSSKDYIPFQSRMSKHKELLDALKDDNNYIIVLQGMGGTGKTTLAIEVGKELQKSEQFAHVIDTTVSFTPDIKKIQDDIAGSLGLEFKDSDRSKKLLNRLTTDEKVLLILDDVWDQESLLDFDLIGIPKKDNHKGCRVLITTRCKQIFHKMSCDKKIELDLLPEAEAWTMFKMYAGISDNSSKSLISTGREIAKECKQLPVAIAVIASSLNGQQDRKHKWDAILKALKKTVPNNVDKEKVGIYKCLKSSYDRMEDEKPKGLFLLSSVFPEDKKISIEILTRLGIGTGLFGENYGNYDDARNQVVVAKDKLVDSCLLMEVGKEHVKMHDLVREAAQWIAYKEIRHVNLSNKDEKSSGQGEKNIKYLFCEGKDMDLFSWKYGGSKLETLILHVEREEDRKCMEAPNSFFDNIGKLQVLNFSGHDRRPLSLPHSIHSLTNIRSILFDEVDLGDISALGNLQGLETLDLVRCIIDELPNEIANLGKFKLLNLEECEIRRNDPFEVIKRCSALEELYFINSFNDFCQEITLPELQRYHIRNGWCSLDDSLSKYVSFDTYDYDDDCFFSKETFKYLMQTIEGLELDGIREQWKNLMPDVYPIELGMKDLVELRLSSFSQLQCLIDNNGSQLPNIFPNLVVLTLDTMESLVELFNGSLSSDFLKSLEKLSIKECKMFQRLSNCKLNLCNLKTVTLCDCPMLVNLSSLLTSGNLMLLEELKILNCVGLKSIIIDETREEGSSEKIYEGDNDNKSYVSIFPKLKVLRIEGCHLLESILPFLSSQDLPVLETVRIRRCHKLKYIFGQYQHLELSSLKEMVLFELPNFMGIFPKYSHSMSLHISETSSTSRDGFKAQIQVNPIECNIFSWSCICCHGINYRHKRENMSTTKVPSVHEDSLQKNSTTSVSNSQCLQLWERAQCLPIQSHIMCNINKIELSGFLKIKSLFILSITPIMLVETLIISNCDELEHIIVDIGDNESGDSNWGNVFPKLKLLRVINCMQLKYIFGHYTDDHQNNNEIHLRLPALQNLELYNLPSLVSLCPKQYLGNTIMKVSYSQCLQLWERVQCLPVQPHIMRNIKQIKLSGFLKIKSVFILSITPRMLVETLIIENCDELKHIIVDSGDDDSVGNNWVKVFPELKMLSVQNCKQLEYIFGRYTDDHQNNNEIHLHLPALQNLELYNLPSLVSLCPKQYRTTFPPLKQLDLSYVSQVAFKSIGEFIINHSNSESLDNTITKESSGGVDYFIALESLVVHNSKVESVFCLNGIHGQQMNLGLKAIHLYELHDMTCLFVGLENSFVLKNLTEIIIEKCETLETVFCASILRCLSQLWYLRISECKMLKHIIKDDQLNQNLSLKTCFPKLKRLSVTKCHKLKYVFPISICEDPIELDSLRIEEVDELEEIFKSEGAQKVEIPNLDSVAFVNLPTTSVSSSHYLQICFPIQPHILCNVKRIELSGVLKIKSVFILSITPRMLVEDLRISFCDELKHIIVDTRDDESGGTDWRNVFPKLKSISVRNCKQLEYIFGHYTDYHPNHTKIHLHLPKLNGISLRNLPNLVAMCPKQYCTTFPNLKQLELTRCPKVDIKSIGEFIMHPDSETQDNTIMQELSGSKEHFIALENLVVHNSKAENIFCLYGVEGQQMNLGLKAIELYDLHCMMCLFVGPKSSFALNNLREIKITGCKILEVVFSTSILSCLSQLIYLKIKKCKELKHIIEDDKQNQKLFSTTSFPKLKILDVRKCHKLKCVFPISTCKELPELKVLMISKANELEEIFKSEGDQKVEIPNLNIVVLDNLPNLIDNQGTLFQAAKNRFVRNCQKLSLTPASTPSVMDDLDAILQRVDAYETRRYFYGVQQLKDEAEGYDTDSEKSTVETTPDIDDDVEIEVEAISRDELISSKGVEEGTALTNAETIIPSTHLEFLSLSQEQDVDVRDSLETTKVNDNQDFQNSKNFEGPSQQLDDETKDYDTGNENPSAETIKDIAVGDEIEVEAALRDKLISSQELEKEQQTSQQGSIYQHDPLGETDTTIKPSQRLIETNEQSIQEDYISEKIGAATKDSTFEIRNEPPPIQLFSPKGVEEGTALTNAKTIIPSTHREFVSLSQEQDVDFRDSLETSKANDAQVSQNEVAVMKVSSVVEIQAPLLPSEEDPSQIVEDLSSPSSVTRELEQLVSKKHLDYKNLSVLTDFLVKHPSFLLTKVLFSNKYKSYAYNCLAELLKFLQTHSVLDVLGSSHSEFVELLREVRECPFDKDWLDGVEKKALFPDLQFSQDALQKVLDSKKQVAKDIEVARLKIEHLKQKLSYSEAVLESIIQQEKEIVESKAALSVPLGY